MAKAAAAAAAATVAKKPNPFERIRNRLKHDVIGRKVKGAERDATQAKTKAIKKRQESLLLEFERLDKKNAFVDKRFGEKDATLTQEDKALQRFQKERVKKIRKASKFNLEDADDDAQDELTHGGVSVSKVMHLSDQQPGEDEEEDQEEEDQEAATGTLEALLGTGDSKMNILRNLGRDTDNKHRSKQEIMHEVMMKSKLFRLERAKEKEQQHELLHQLDTSFSDIRKLMEFKSAEDQMAEKSEKRLDDVLMRRKPKKQQEQQQSSLSLDTGDTVSGHSALDREAQTLLEAIRADGHAATEEINSVDDFSRMAKELAMDTRARASERKRTPEEVAQEEKARLEMLEALRIRRMKGLDVEEDTTQLKKERRKRKHKGQDAASQPVGTKKLKQRPPAVTDDDLVGNAEIDQSYVAGSEGGEEEEEEEFQEDGVYVKNAETDNPLESEDEDQIDPVEEDGEEKSAAEDSDDDGRDADGADNNDDTVDGKNQMAGTSILGKFADDDRDSDDDSLGDLDLDEVYHTITQTASPLAGSYSNVKSSQAAADVSNPELPFTFAAPSSYAAFANYIRDRPLQDHAIVIQRIITCNHPSLGADYQHKMEPINLLNVLESPLDAVEFKQKFFSILLDYLTTVTSIHPQFPASSSSSSSPSSSSTSDILLALDMLSTATFQLAELIPKQAGSVIRARLNLMRDRVRIRAAQKAPSLWPTADELLLLKLISNIFPVSDFRHNVTTSAMLFMCEALTRLPVTCGKEVGMALYLCALLLHYTDQSHRFVPEVPCFLRELLAMGFGFDSQRSLSTSNPLAPVIKDSVATAASSPLRNDIASQVLPVTFPHSLATLLWSADFLSSSNLMPVEKLDLLQTLLLPASDAYFSSDVFRTGALAVTLQLIQHCAEHYGSLPSAPEIFAPIFRTLEQAQPIIESSNARFPQIIRSRCTSLIAHLKERCERAIRNRNPLAKQIVPKPLKQFTPVFVENFAPERDMDPNKERAEMRKLKRKVKKEKKGALRELRRDTEFLEHERQKKVATEKQTKEKKRKEVLNFLEQQQRDTNLTSGKNQKRTVKNPRARIAKKGGGGPNKKRKI